MSKSKVVAAPVAGPGESTQQIVAAITRAIVEHRLQPGAKLGEQRIADLFAVSRTVVRQALNQLSRDRLVRLEPARGAFVATPSLEEARAVFAVRIMLETACVQQLAGLITDAQVAALRAHLRAEALAVERVDVPLRTRLLADFHVILAQQLGNAVLADLLSDLLDRSALIVLMYQSDGAAVASRSGHVDIVEALARRDGRAAARLMKQHIGRVAEQLRQDVPAHDLAGALAPESLQPSGPPQVPVPRARRATRSGRS